MPAAQAQEGVSVRITPRVGVIDLGRELYDVSITNGDTYLSSASLPRARIVGIAADVGSPERGLLLRLSADRTLPSDADVSLGIRFGEFGGGLGPRILTVPWSLTELGADVVLPLRLEVGPVHPYLSAGVGVRHYAFDIPEPSFDVRREWALPQSGVSSSVRLGGGAEIGVFSQRFTVTLLDAIGLYWGEPKHHVIASLGYTFGV